ncbi:thioredoxin-like protein [Obelidium mucronatum]|nr:thioredoxin-like protein [Obelidium mucronatum]
MAITLYTYGSPNGWKASIILEELKAHYGLEYNVHSVSFAKNEQKEEWYLKMNPNGRIPVIVDHNRSDFVVFESGAILLYLAEHYDPENILFPEDSNARSQVIQWIMWQMGGLGPMMGQSWHFRYASEKLALKDGREYLVGDAYSIADIASFGWVASHEYATGETLDAFPLLTKWLHRIALRPAVAAGLNVPTKNTWIEDDFKAPKKAEE